MAASSPAVKAWPLNWFVAIDWLLHVFRSILPTTLLKVFSTCGGVLGNQLDENGNPLPIEEASSKLDEATPDAAQSRKVSSFLEDQVSQKSANSADGKAAKYRKEVGGKDAGRRGPKAPGKASTQNKPKAQKSKKTEIGTKATKILEHESSAEQGTSPEAKNQKLDDRNAVKNAEEECSGERDDELVVSLSEPDAADDGDDDDFNDAENTLINDDVSRICASGRQDLEPINAAVQAESNQRIPEDKVSSGQSQSRKKRRRGKQKKQPNSNPDSSSSCIRISAMSLRVTDPVLDSSLVVLPSSVSPTNSVNSVSFCCRSPLNNAREKPSARVPPSRSTAIGCALNSTEDTGFVLGEKISSDLDEKALGELPVLGHLRIDEVKFCDSECEELAKMSPFLKVEADSSADGKPRPHLEAVQPIRKDLARQMSAEVIREILPETQPCTTASGCPLSPSRKQCTLIGQVSREVKVKPQSTVNPFSVLDSSTSVKPLHAVNQSHLPAAAQTRVKVELTADTKPKVTQPPRFKPRFMVDPLHLDQSPQIRVRFHPKVDPASSSTDLVVQTPNNLTAVKNAPVSEPNPVFRILRRRQSGTSKDISTSPAKHFDSSHTNIHNSVVTTEQCPNGSYDSRCHSNFRPSVAKTTVGALSCNDNEATTTKSRFVAKKRQNSNSLNRRCMDLDTIHESIRSSTHCASSNVESWAVDTECGFRDASSTCDRLPSKPRPCPKNSGSKTNLCSAQVAPNAVTFDLSRAQQYLRAEFLKTMELKKRGFDVIVLKL